MSDDNKNSLPRRYRKGVLADVKRSTMEGRQLSETFAAVIADAGGVDRMTTGSMMLAERLTFLDAMLRAWERQIADDPFGNPELVGRWTQGTNTLSGLVKALRLDRDRDNAVIDVLYADDDPDDDPENAPENAPSSPSKPRKREGP